MTRIRTGLALLTFATAAGLAHAGRPLATEDADVLNRGDCELEGFVADARESGFGSTRGWTTQLGCGVGFSTQVALAYTRARFAGETTSGLLFGGKTALVPREGERLGLTLAWGLAGEKPPGESFEHEVSYLNLVATKSYASGWTTHANLGWTRSESASASTTTWNLAAERAMGGGLDLMAEVYGDDRARPWLGLGARWQASEKLSVNASWATQNESPRVRLWTVGFKFAF